jgi:hypothetical protein
MLSSNGIKKKLFKRSAEYKTADEEISIPTKSRMLNMLDDSQSVASYANDEDPDLLNVASDISAAEGSKKKGPGRPRKVPKKSPTPRKGISTTPMDAENIVEFVYDAPIVIKRLVSFFRSVSSIQIQIIFRSTEVIFYAEDHLKKSQIRIKIDGSKLNHYYCKQTLNVAVSCLDLDKPMNKVDKEYTNIIIASSQENSQKNLTIILKNDIQIDEVHTIELVGLTNPLLDESPFNTDAYAIQFELPGRAFRKMMTDINAISKQMWIKMDDPEAEMEFGYISGNRKIKSRHVVKDKNKIKLSSTMKADESFRIDLKVDYVKTISSAHIAEYITIMCDEKKPFTTRAYIDDRTIEIRTITEIIDERPA